jgi:sugar porter (SP) family MFS transporter
MSGGLIHKSRGEAKPFLFVLAAVAALGGFLFGYDTGVISGALLFIKPAFHASTFQQQSIIGSLLVGAVVGAAASGYLAEAMSRKWTKVLSGCIYVAAALWSAFASGATELIAARFLLGLAVGTASFVAPMYIAEVAPRQIRGGLVSFNQMMVVLGILTAYIVDFVFKDVADNWRWMLGLGAIPGVALAVGMILMPHSPRWLMERGRDDEARAVLKRVHRRAEGIDEEMNDIRQVVAKEGSLRDIIGAKVRPMLIVGVALAIFQQIVGINTVIYYAPTILRFTGSSVSSAITQTVFIGLTNVVFTLVAVLLLDRFGRRVFLLVGTVGLIVSLVVLGVFFASPAVRHAVPDLALIALIVYIASFAIGLGPVFWLMISEIFPLHLRAPAMALCTITNWAFNFIVSFTFLSVVGALGRTGTFLLYATLGVLALIFFATRVPETNGRSLEEIEQQLKRRRLGRIWGQHDAPAVVTASARRPKGTIGT